MHEETAVCVGSANEKEALGAHPGSAVRAHGGGSGGGGGGSSSRKRRRRRKRMMMMR